MNKKQIALIAATYLGTFMSTLDISIVNVALPTIQENLKVSMGGMQWIIDAYAVCLAAFILASGAFSSKYGMKRVWMIGIAGFVGSSFLCSISKSLCPLLIGRALQGVSAALIIPGALSIIFHAIEDGQLRSRIVGGWSACTAIALICGPGLGGVLVDTAGWQSIFIINLPIGGLALCLSAWGIKEFIEKKNAPIDILGQIFSILWISGAIYALIQTGESTKPLASLAILPFLSALLIIFFFIEKKAKQPLIPFSLFQNKSFSLSNLASFVLGFSYYSSLFFLSLFFQEAQGVSATQAGSRMVPAFVLAAVISFIFGGLNTIFSVQKLLISGYALIGFSMCALGFSTTTTPYWHTGVLLAIMGAGVGLSVPATSISILSQADNANLSIASSIMNALRQAGMAFGIAILGSIMSITSFIHAKIQLHAQGIADAASKAHALMVDRHRVDLQVKSIYCQASACGFQWVMLIAGSLCLGIAGCFILHSYRNK